MLQSEISTFYLLQEQKILGGWASVYVGYNLDEIRKKKENPVGMPLYQGGKLRILEEKRTVVE